MIPSAASSSTVEDTGRIYEEGWQARWDAMRAAWLFAKTSGNNRSSEIRYLFFVFIIAMVFVC